MFTDASDFISTGIKPIITETERLHVLFATYNNVGNGKYESGPVQTNKEGLTIQVQNGNLRYSPMTDFIYLMGTPFERFAEIGARAMDDEARGAQATVESSLNIETREGIPFIAVVYAGLSAFDEALGMASDIKLNHPAAQVIIVTCDCMLHDKACKLNPMIANGQIKEVVITPICGGRMTMSAILESIIGEWPVKAMT